MSYLGLYARILSSVNYEDTTAIALSVLSHLRGLRQFKIPPNTDFPLTMKSSSRSRVRTIKNFAELI